MRSSERLIRFAETSIGKILVLIIIGIIWSVPFALFFYGGPSSKALEPTPGRAEPTILLEPTLGQPGMNVTVNGKGWPANSMVLIYLKSPEEQELPAYATAGAVTDRAGRFTTGFVFPVEPRWEGQEQAAVIARVADGGLSAQANFKLVKPETPTDAEPTVMPGLNETTEPIAPVEPTATPVLRGTEGPALSETVEPPIVASTPTVTPAPPVVTALANLNIRSGPGTAYPLIGWLRAGQSAEVTGLNFDAGWVQIEFAGVAEGRGWVSARYVAAPDLLSGVPLVQAPPPPAPPTPTPLLISDWRGEYFDNPNLSGAAALVRNDSEINFDWGEDAPGPGVPTDNFSARWTRSLYFPAGTYRFYAHADDGVRLWVDGNLVVDQWRDSPPTTYTADVSLAEGSHSLRLEYYERGGGALAQLSWQRLETYFDWKGEYFNNPNLSGGPVFVRNDHDINFNWGPHAPGPGVPADNFSARWTRNLNFRAGTYGFRVLVDDGARLWVNDKLVIDRWRTGPPKSYTAEINLTEGTHHLRLEYFDHTYDAQVRLSWERLDHYPDWKAEYFDNRQLRGSPILVRNESNIDHDWGRGSPGGVPSDNFSARWTRQLEFESGVYRFQVRVDDGVRVWVGDTLVIDAWREGGSRLIEAERQMSGGKHRVKVEYYERTGDARIQVKWRRLEEPANQPPQAVLGGPFTVDEGSPITFDGRGSRDSDGNIVKYEWDFNYNGHAFTVNAIGPTASASYPDGPATATVALRVTDDKGASHMTAAAVTIQNVAPVAKASGPYSGQVGGLINFAGAGTDASPIDQATLVYDWDFGDGVTGSGQLASHTYRQADDYTITLTVTDKDGAAGVHTTTVQVRPVNQPPRAIINGPENGVVGDILTFSGSDSNDGDGHIASYDWNFGDGTIASGVKATHVYSEAGSYQIILTVTDDGGLIDKVTHAVQIEPPVPANLPPEAVIAALETAQVGQEVTFDASGSSDSDGYIVSYAWDFGDGAVADGVVVTHTYNEPGQYKIKLIVTDDGGLAGKVKHIIQIEPPVQVDA